MTEVTGFKENANVNKTTELVLVCCHATYMGEGVNTAEDQWVLQSFQQSDPLRNKPGEHETFVQHILSAALAVHNDPRALLIFSGGKTSPAPRTEAESYAPILRHFVRHNPVLFPAGVRYGLESFATDSYQNLLFSIIRFRQLTGTYPTNITVITHAFKERRFLELHAPAIKWPSNRIRVMGINPPFSVDELNFTHKMEYERAYKLFAGDPYGVRMPLLQKRLERNWNTDRAHVFLGWKLESQIIDLLEWHGGVSGCETFPGQLPWEDQTKGWMSPRG